ncbi:TPA: hypothetical protein DDW35_05280 [Candidatus Sumerlaeota bacterium]|jgi:hypothetical protein|nr:hypothetical protein [Candidatus Sumerlaeota bacterium]
MADNFEEEVGKICHCKLFDGLECYLDEDGFRVVETPDGNVVGLNLLTEGAEDLSAYNKGFEEGCAGDAFLDSYVWMSEASISYVLGYFDGLREKMQLEGKGELSFGEDVCFVLVGDVRAQVI